MVRLLIFHLFASLSLVIG